MASKRVQHLHVEGMNCGGCADQVEQALRTLAGVETVEVNVSEATASIAGDVEPGDLINALSGTNYQARPLGSDSES